MAKKDLAITPIWQIFGTSQDLQQPFDVAVVMPTIIRESIYDAINSVFHQAPTLRIQLLIGIDFPTGNLDHLKDLLSSSPAHVTPILFYPGYSTSVRHGGMHPARDGGSLRTSLSYMANARYLAYLDDDNWWSDNHLASLMRAIQGHQWAFSLRWFVHPVSRQPVCIDDWESVGPERGVFATKFGGWVDPNCLLIEKMSCEPALRWWSIPLPGDQNAMSGDRHVFDWLKQSGKPGESNIASVNYVMQPTDLLHPERVYRMQDRYGRAALPKQQRPPRLTAVTVCKNRLHHLKQTLPLLAQQDGMEVIVVDYGCPQGTATWVRENYPEVKVVEVTDDPKFNLSRGRNLGAAAANTPWLLFIDADVLIQESFGQWWRKSLHSGQFYVSSRLGTELDGTNWVPRVAWREIGGYDEAITGWGGEDHDFYKRLQRAGLAWSNFPDTLFLPILHTDAERFAEGGASRQRQEILIHWYQCAKDDLMDIEGAQLDFSECMRLREIVVRAVDGILGTTESQRPAGFFLDLSERKDAVVSYKGWYINRQIRYTLQARSKKQAAQSDNTDSGNDR